jgi:DNA helicase-2/ATP-dependent DNA helicase PcrA
MTKVTKIYGPPGTGKTTWMLNRLEQELEHVPLQRIAYVTFSVAARQEAISRAQLRIPASRDQFRYFKTIHGICYSEAHLSGFNVMQPADFLCFGKEHGIKFSDDYTEDYGLDGLPEGWSTSEGNSILNIRQVASARGIDPLSDECRFRDWPADISQRDITHVLREYALYKEQNTKFDFVDMLQMYSVEGDPLPIDVMFIDEAQDLSKLQWAIVEKMYTNAQRVYLAGDDDQSIYGFLGADAGGFYHHPADETVFLSKSYRLREQIWKVANGIISTVHDRQDKPVEVRANGGIVERWNRNPDEVLARIQSSDDVMVISSTNHQLAGLASRLEYSGTPVTYKGRAITGDEHAKLIYWYHKIKAGENVALRVAAGILKLARIDAYRSLSERARTNPDERIGRNDLEALGLSFDAYWVDYLSSGGKYRRVNDKLRQIGILQGIEALLSKPKIELTTYHAAKGREAHTVILVTDCSPSAFDYAVRDPDNERRVAYVGVTRAKERLVIISPQTPEYMRAFQ